MSEPRALRRSVRACILAMIRDEVWPARVFARDPPTWCGNTETWTGPDVRHVCREEAERAKSALEREWKRKVPHA